MAAPSLWACLTWTTLCLFAPIHPFNLAPNGCLMGRSKIESKEGMLELARSKGIKPWFEEMPMCEVGKALQKLKDNKVRYR